MANGKLLRRSLIVLVVASSCGPPAPPPNPVVGTTHTSGTYTALVQTNGVAECWARVHLELSLVGDSRLDVWSNVVEVSGPAPGCVYAAWLLNASVECVPQCGKAYLALPFLEQSYTPMAFTRWPNFAFVRVTLSGTWSGISTGTRTDDSAPIGCDPPPLSPRCVFETPSPN